MSEWEPKPIANIPERLHRPLWGGLDQNELEICFWWNDEDADLFLYLSPEEVKEIEDYGVSDELLDWMRDNDMQKAVHTTDINGDIGVYESFIITDEIVSKFYDQQYKGAPTK